MKASQSLTVDATSAVKRDIALANVLALEAVEILIVTRIGKPAVRGEIRLELTNPNSRARKGGKKRW